MKRSKKYPKSTNAWMAERGWVDLTGCPRYVRSAVLVVGVPTRWRARLFAPAWVMRVYHTLENVMSSNGVPNNSWDNLKPTSATYTDLEFVSILRAVQKDPGAFDPETALAAYRLGGKSALLAVLGAP